jgi:hypothetical protein
MNYLWAISELRLVGGPARGTSVQAYTKVVKFWIDEKKYEEPIKVNM